MFSRLDETERDTASVTEGLRTTLALVEANFKTQVEFVTEFRADPLLECSLAQLNQVFMNLAINACQAMISSPRDEQQAPNKLEVSTFVSNDQLMIQFRDNGPGMPEEIKKQIFDPFFTTKQVGEGTGLGLSISFGIIERHKGKILIDSVPGVGSTFTVSLPI